MNAPVVRKKTVVRMGRRRRRRRERGLEGSLRGWLALLLGSFGRGGGGGGDGGGEVPGGGGVVIAELNRVGCCICEVMGRGKRRTWRLYITARGILHRPWAKVVVMICNIIIQEV